MAAWAKPGTECVCVNVAGISRHKDWPTPEVGAVYVIQTVDQSDGTLLLVGLTVYGNNWFSGWRFRPLVTHTQEQDVGLFIHHFDGLGVDA